MALIRIQNTSNINAEGNHTRRNAKAVFCITTGDVYASATDAAERLGCAPSTVSWAATKRMKTCKGLRLCYVSDITEYLEEIAVCARARETKVVAYNAIVEKEKALKEANDSVTRHQAKCEELRRQLAAEEQALKTAEAAVNNLIRG